MISTRSLVARLMLIVGAIVLMAFGAGAWIVHRSAASTYREIQREVQVDRGTASEPRELIVSLEAAYARGGWEAVRAYALEPGASRPAFLVLSTSNQVNAATGREWQQAAVRAAPGGGLVVSIERTLGGRVSVQEFATTAVRDLQAADGGVWGRLVLLPQDQPEPRDAGRAFAARFWRSAAASLAVVLLAAVVSIAWVMRRSLAPIGQLTRAARDLQAGKAPAPLTHHGPAEFQELVDAYNTAAESIARTERLRRDLISDIAHELRTPLTNLKGQVEALQQGLLQADRDFGTTLQTEVRLLERLVNDVHQLALTDAGQLHVHPVPAALRELLERLAAPLVSAVGGTLTVTGAAEVWCMADEERLRQVLANLVDNAVRHQPDGLRIAIAAAAAAGHASFRFQDNGPGIDEADRPYIFDRFYRAEKSRNRATGGAGLGLAIVQGLLRAMGGSIRYDAVPGAGATFVVELPAAADPSLGSRTATADR